MKFGKLLLASAAVFAMSVLASVANAATITVGFQQIGFNGDAITTVPTTGTGLLVYGSSYGNFTSAGTASGSPPNAFGELLASTSQSIASTSAGGTFNVYITSQGNSAPSGNLTFISSLTSNLLPAGWTVTQSTFLDSGNGLFGGTLLSSHTFNAAGAFTGVAAGDTGPGLYSVTQLYTIVANSAGTLALSTMSISAVPGPMVGAGLPGLLAAAAGLLALARRRRKVAV